MLGRARNNVGGIGVGEMFLTPQEVPSNGGLWSWDTDFSLG